MALAPAGRAKEQDIRTLIKPAVVGGERHDPRLADYGDSVEVKGVERLARWQSRAGKMPRDAATAAVGHLVFGESSTRAASMVLLLVMPRPQAGGRLDDMDSRGQMERLLIEPPIR
jgi:hypothetical protein